MRKFEGEGRRGGKKRQKHNEVRLLRRKVGKDRQEMKQEKQRKFGGKGGRKNKKVKVKEKEVLGLSGERE